jgi:hypothetical protein
MMGVLSLESHFFVWTLGDFAIHCHCFFRVFHNNPLEYDILKVVFSFLDFLIDIELGFPRIIIGWTANLIFVERYSMARFR